MPYIKQDIRNAIDDQILDLLATLKVYSNSNDALCGNLNYIIFKIIK